MVCTASGGVMGASEISVLALYDSFRVETPRIIS